MLKFHAIVQSWMGCPDFTLEEKRTFIERELQWAEEDERKLRSLDTKALAAVSIERCAN